MKERLRCCRIQIVESLSGYRFLIKSTVIVFFIYLVGLSALLRSNFYYMDDIARALRGYTAWGFSRHLSNILAPFLHADGFLADISPFSQLIAIALTALASVLCIYIITNEKRITLIQIISAIPIGLSPYYLECLSFKYDAPYMAISVLISVVPLLLCDSRPLYYVLSTVCAMQIMCTTYQASAGIFPMLVIVVGICKWVKGASVQSVAKFYGVSSAGYIAGMLFFRLVLMTEYIDYASTTVATGANLLPCVITNYKKYIWHFLHEFKWEWLLLSALIFVCFIVTAVRASRGRKVLTFLLTGLALVVEFLLAFGAYPFLTDALFAPRAMYGIGCMIGFAGIFAVSKVPKAWASKLLCLILGWGFFVFSLVYGNALYMQAEYTDYRITQVITDLRQCETLHNENVTLQVTGSIGYAPAVEHMVENYPILEELVHITFQGDGWWGEYGLRYYYDLPDMLFAQTYDPPQREMEMIATNYFHTIWQDDTYIWVELHDIQGRRAF